ncbi:gem-associated protein 6 [Brachyistius frenatus]|uniref:gem-associated protein 6 n=1 Tax=Brachyistius frenatus TaxID=100188 RepID=UPI0037E8C020
MQRGWCLLGPLQWTRFIDKQVMVKAGKHEEYCGWLLTVDPVSASMVLVNFSEGRTSVQVVMGHAVEEVKVLQAADQETARRLRTLFLPPTTPILVPHELSRRKGSVRQWLERNRIPVEEQGDDLRVAGVLTITAPYRPEDCCSSNQIILGRIQKLIQAQPGPPETGPGPGPD